MPDPASLEPVAETLTDVPDFHRLPPPTMFGAVGTVRSIRAYAVTHAETLPALSTEWNCTQLLPSLLTGHVEASETAP